ncbi:MAG: mannose-6-phosphate isomerase, class I [Alicyclobacillaceae bacterium]|nr:mannose-6-phosphate isomerase, class I [Alicyclobacillaceae bacterium]
MDAYPLRFHPVFKERIWGGSRLRSLGYQIPSDRTGEAWVISDHDHGPSPVADGPLAGRRIAEIMREYPHWFGDVAWERFPLLVKVIDAADDLSVQVHPDDAYARLRGDWGKTECWYVLDAEPGACIVYGHRARDREVLKQMMESGRWDDLLVRVNVRAGDFIFVPSGTLHALGRGLLVLEIQQSSDTTYRVYDYDRVDTGGRKRELHLADALAVTRCPSPPLRRPGRARSGREGAEIDHLLFCDAFSVEKWKVNGMTAFPQRDVFVLLSVLEGEGRLVYGDRSWALHRGDHLLLPRPLTSAKAAGRMTLLVSVPSVSTH